MANYNRPRPIRSLPHLPPPMLFLRGRCMWDVSVPPGRPQYTPNISTPTCMQTVSPLLPQPPPPPLLCQQPPLSSSWRIPGHYPPTHYPIHHTQHQPQQQQVLNYEVVKPAVNDVSIFNSWLHYYEPIFIERRKHFKQQNNIQLPVYRNMLIKWSELIKKLQQVDEQKDDNSSTSPLVPLKELYTLQANCTNPHVIGLVGKKLRAIRKKRRYLKRVQECGQNSNLKSTPIIVHTTTGSILERLKSDMLSDIELPKSDEENTTTVSIEQIDDNADGDGYHNRLSADDCASSERCITASTTVRKSIVKDESFGGNKLFPDCYSPVSSQPNLNQRNCTTTKYYNQMKMILRKSIDECQMRIKLLDSLQQLRSVRLTQAKQQGGLFPHQVDEKFNFDISELKDLLLGQAAKLESSYAKVKDILRYRENLQSKHNYNAISQTQSSCCIHVPNLSKSLQIKLFGNHCTTKLSDIPQRWQRFYHQADYNFCDFIRIRYAWDKYLKTDISLSDQLDNYELPRHWILPEMDRNEQKEKEKEATNNKDTTTDCTEKGVSNVHDKWVRYLKVIPVSICSTSCSSSDFVPS